MTDEIKIAVFKKLLDEFETDEMRLYCEDMIRQIPDYIFEMPSSTTGKYHNKTTYYSVLKVLFDFYEHYQNKTFYHNNIRKQNLMLNNPHPKHLGLQWYKYPDC